MKFNKLIEDLSNGKYDVIEKIKSKDLKVSDKIFIRDIVLDGEAIISEHRGIYSIDNLAFDMITSFLLLSRSTDIDFGKNGLDYSYDDFDVLSKNDVINKIITESTENYMFIMELKKEVETNASLMNTQHYAIKNGIDSLLGKLPSESSLMSLMANAPKMIELINQSETLSKLSPLVENRVAKEEKKEKQKIDISKIVAN